MTVIHRDNAQVLFLAMGYPYVVMAINAARSVRQSGTAAHIKLITNVPIRRILFRGSEPFDSIEVVDRETSSNRWIKTRMIDHADVGRNVLLDCDVEVLAPLNPLMGLLDRFDVAARNLPFETRQKFVVDNGPNVKDLFLSEINTGVIFFSRSAGARELFDLWHANFLKVGHSRDQPSFLKALLEARTTRFLALPPMWNATPFHYVDRREMRKKPQAIRILHYRDPIFWPAVAGRLADAHEEAIIELRHPSTEVDEQRDAYSALSRQYRSVLFPFAAGRALLTWRMVLASGDRQTRLRVVGKRKTPEVPS
jgi:hypothetical protein